MVWLQPAVLIGLIALAGPVAVHLLRRHQARRIVVPSVRFMQATDRSDVRLRKISDPLLLLIRAAIIACSVLALAQPLLLTDQRIAAWGKRTARAVIIDSSEGARPAAIGDVIAAEASGANPVASLETTDLRLAVRRAAGWLATSPPVRREIVLVSDFQRGAIDAGTLARVPQGIGIRFVRSRSVLAPHMVDPVALLDADGSFTVAPGAAPSGTRLTYSRRPSDWSGMQIHGLPSGDAPPSLLRIVERAGAYAPDVKQPITIQFDDAQPRSSDMTSGDWTFGAALRLLRATSSLGVPIGVSSSHGSLGVHAQANPTSLAAARIVQAALDARVPVGHFQESEPERIDDATLASWTREPAAPDVRQWRQTDESEDSRWLWATALVLLALEAYSRRSSARHQHQVMNHAA